MHEKKNRWFYLHVQLASFAKALPAHFWNVDSILKEAGSTWACQSTIQPRHPSQRLVLTLSESFVGCYRICAAAWMTGGYIHCIWACHATAAVSRRCYATPPCHAHVQETSHLQYMYGGHTACRASWFASGAPARNWTQEVYRLQPICGHSGVGAQTKTWCNRTPSFKQFSPNKSSVNV